MSALQTLEAAQERLLGLAAELAIGSESVATESALGRVLAADLTARRTQPPADLSAMDGYAIAGPGPWALVGESRAGTPFTGTLTSGETTRISTGAHMPLGSDRVLIQENAEVADGSVSALHMPDASKHVRKAGFDFSKGDAVLAAGDPLTPARIALAMAAGFGEIEVARRPKVAILDSGDELVRDPAACAPDQIPASNGAMIAAMLAPLVGKAERLGPVPDDASLLAAALEQAEDSDILITSGGASVGDHDLIQPALMDWGAKLTFWKVAIKPGKPLMVATRKGPRGQQVVLGLPGNPVSSFVTAFLFALPLVRAAMGMREPLPGQQTLTAAQKLPATGSRQEFLRAVSDNGKVRLAASQDSSALLALAGANCLINRPAGAPTVAEGESVPVYNLQNG